MKEVKSHKFVEFIKPSWLKLLFTVLYIVPLSPLYSSFISMIFTFFSLFLVSVIRASNPDFVIPEFVIFLIPLILSIILVYLTACFIVSIYKRKNNKKFLYIMIAIGIILTIILIVLSFLFLSLFR